MEKICPCLQIFFKKKEERPTYNPSAEYEEQEYLNHDERPSLVDTIQKPKPKSSPQAKIQPQQKVNPFVSQTKIYKQAEKLIDEDDSERLVPEKQPSLGPQYNAIIQQKQPIKPSQDHEEPLTEVQNIIQKEQVDQKIDRAQQVQDDKFDKKFINLDKSDVYYGLLSSKAEEAKSIFDLQSQIVQIQGENKTKTKFEKRQTQNIQILKAIFRYKLSCDYTYYQSLLKNEKNQLKLSKTIYESKTLESIKPNLTINQICFKKYQNIEASLFKYIKYENQIQKQHWNLCISIETDRVPQSITRELFVVRRCIEANENELEISEYFQIDLKQEIKNENMFISFAKLYQQYLNNLQNYIVENYQQVSA